MNRTIFSIAKTFIIWYNGITPRKEVTNMKASSLLRIGDRIRELREDKQWTQKQLAEASQLNEVQIRRYENNQSLPRDAQLIKIANALGVDKEELFKEKVYRISIPTADDIKNKKPAPASFSDLRKKMESMQEKIENISKSFDNARKSQLEFIQAFLEDKKNDNAEVDRIADLLWFYDCLEEDEKKAFIYLSKIFALTNIPGKNKMLDFSDIIFGNSDYRKEE